MGAGSSNKGAKTLFSGYYICQKSPKNSFLPSDGGGASLFKGGSVLSCQPV